MDPVGVDIGWLLIAEVIQIPGARWTQQTQQWKPSTSEGKHVCKRPIVHCIMLDIVPFHLTAWVIEGSKTNFVIYSGWWKWRLCQGCSCLMDHGAEVSDAVREAPCNMETAIPRSTSCMAHLSTFWIILVLSSYLPFGLLLSNLGVKCIQIHP